MEAKMCGMPPAAVFSLLSEKRQEKRDSQGGLSTKPTPLTIPPILVTLIITISSFSLNGAVGTASGHIPLIVSVIELAERFDRKYIKKADRH